MVGSGVPPVAAIYQLTVHAGGGVTARLAMVGAPEAHKLCGDDAVGGFGCTVKLMITSSVDWHDPLLMVHLRV